MPFGTIALDAAKGARMASVLVADRSLLDGEGIFVGAGRGLSRRVVHKSDDNLARRTARRLSPGIAGTRRQQVESSWIGRIVTF